MTPTSYLCIIVDLDTHEPIAFRVDDAASPGAAWDLLTDAFDNDDDCAIVEYDKAACIPIAAGAVEPPFALYGSAGEPLAVHPMPGVGSERTPAAIAPSAG